MNILCQDVHSKGEKWQGPAEGDELKKKWQGCTDLTKEVLMTQITAMLLPSHSPRAKTSWNAMSSGYYYNKQS